jgi:hypothetical protein
MVVADAAAAALMDALRGGMVIGPTVSELAAAVAGGTVGVMGTMIALEITRQRARERKQCPYCTGSGKLPCGTCCSLGALPSHGEVGDGITAGGMGMAQVDCVCCKAKGYVRCEACEGEGRLIPVDFERALRAQYDNFDDDYLFGGGGDDLL